MTAYSDAVLADSPLLYLRFEETSGATCANSGSLGGNATASGTYTRNVASPHANLGVAIDLQGSGDDDYVSYPHNAAFWLDHSATYEAWIKADTFPGALNYIMSKGVTTTGPFRSLGFFVRSTGFIAVQMTGLGSTTILETSPGVIATGTWYHVAATIDSTGKTFVIYVNGASAASTTLGSAPGIDVSNNTLPFDVGRLTNQSGAQWGWDGQIDEAAVYGTTLSSTRIAAHYAAYNAAAAPAANFTGTPLSGTEPLGVAFTDSSTNTPTSWAWTFGDGGTSTSQNPTHTYTTAGTFTVALVATNSAGSNTLTRTGYVTVSDQPRPVRINTSQGWVDIGDATAFVSGSGAPTAAAGATGAIYLDTASGRMYGPKAGGAWPATALGGITGASGTTAARPASVPVGYGYWDTTLGKPVWWNGTVWKDATGTTV